MKTYQLSDITEKIIENNFNSTQVIFCLDDENSIIIDDSIAYFSDDNRETENLLLEEFASEFILLAEQAIYENEQERLLYQFEDQY